MNFSILLFTFGLFVVNLVTQMVPCSFTAYCPRQCVVCLSISCSLCEFVAFIVIKVLNSEIDLME